MNVLKMRSTVKRVMIRFDLNVPLRDGQGHQ